MRWEIGVLFSLFLFVSAWDDDDFEVFDVVEEVNQNFYELLGVAQDASSLEIKTAFRKLTLKLHPDKNDAPDADVQFRNLVSVHNIVRDPGKREKYDEVLKNGLPNWKSAVYYYRHVRKMGLAEGSLILFIIISFGQYAVSWAAYAEKKYTAEYILTKTGKKNTRKPGFESGIAEVLDKLPKPSIKDTLPFQIPRWIWWSIVSTPAGILDLWRSAQERKEEAKRQKLREEEELLRAARAAQAAEEAREARAGAGGARRRRGFVPPERVGGGEGAGGQGDHGDHGDLVKRSAAPSPPVITGGLWTDDDLAELVRLVKKYPGGAAERWERIAESMGRSVAEVTHMAAKLKENCYKLPGQETVEVQPVEVPKKVKTRKAEEPVSGGNWAQNQQKALEAALAKHPKGGAADRWAKIAAAVPGKTKEECMQRCKYLSDLVRKQKQKEEESKEDERESKEDERVIGENGINDIDNEEITS